MLSVHNLIKIVFYSNVMVLCYINAFTTGNTLLCDMIFQADTYNICGTAETFNQNPKKNIFGDISSLSVY